MGRVPWMQDDASRYYEEAEELVWEFLDEALTRRRKSRFERAVCEAALCVLEKHASELMEHPVLEDAIRDYVAERCHEAEEPVDRGD